jgi:molybdopterin biosynthesis enzyme
VFHGVRLKPGGSCAFGIVGGRPVFAAPGGLADMLAVNLVLSPPFARQMFGRPPGAPARRQAKLTCGLPGTPNASALRLAHLGDKGITPIVEESLTPLDIASANAAIFVPEGSRHRRKGETVPFILLGTAM